MTMSPAQQAAVDSTANRLACLAAPGSGKTSVLVGRICRLLGEGVWPGEILAVTFTRKAAREMHDRVEAAGIPKREARRLTIGTFHALANGVLREFPDVTGLDRLFTIRDDADRDDLVRWVGAELGSKHKSARRLWQEPDVRQRYRQLLRECAAIDYDGLEDGLLALARHPHVGEILRQRWTHVLVDEAQDTSPVQQQILSTLNPAHLFVVGDPGQSIYGFRGADMAGFLGMIEGWERVDLTTNYRSARRIVRAASRLGAAMAPPGLVQAAEVEEEGGTWMVRSSQSDVSEDGPPDARSAALDRVAVDVATAVDWGLSPDSIAILSPTWSHLEAMALHLESAGVPHRIAKRAADLWDSEECRWLAAVMRAARNGGDHVSLLRVVNHAAARVPLWRWASVRAQASSAGLDLREVLRTQAPAVMAAVDAARGGDIDGAAALLVEDLESLHLASRADRLRKSMAAAREWIYARGATWDAWLDWYGMRGVEQDVEPETEPGVTLTTIHGAKGLEWGSVYILGCEEGLLPRPGDVEEQRRLFYVGTTRARRSVTWVSWGDPSRFIREAAGMDVIVRTLCEVDGRLLAAGVNADLAGEWCLLGPDGLPCAIGTPPEAERERLERERLTRALVDEYERMLQAEAEGCCTCTSCYGDDFGAAARALADHIIKEQGP